MDAFAAVREICQRYRAGGVIMPDVLRVAEQAHDDQQPPNRQTVLLATVAGDVHHIGKSLLAALFSATGYKVVDLGNQVPVDDIVSAAIDCDADAIGLSALLVTSSKQMPRAIDALDRRGVHVPVLIGGAALNRAFGRRAGILPDGRIYEPGVFYCKDVFEGLATLDALFDPSARDDLLARTRAEALAERDRPTQPPLVVEDTRPSTQRRVEVPRPPYFGSRKIDALLAEVWQHLDLNTLYRHHWGGFPARGAEFERVVQAAFEPRLRGLQEEAVRDGWLEPRIVSGYFACRADGDALNVFHGSSHVRFDFPRQPSGDRLCLSDFFRSDMDDVLALQAVSTGARVGAFVDELFRSGEYVRMLFVNGLSAATAEALAEYAHMLVRSELGLSPERSLRFSWGYPACPDLDEQRKVLPLLQAERLIGLTLSESANLDPEHSTAAMVVHHPDVSYFAVRPPA